MDNESLEDKNDDEEEDKEHFFEGKEGGKEEMLRARGRRQGEGGKRERIVIRNIGWRSVRKTGK